MTVDRRGTPTIVCRKLCKWYGKVVGVNDLHLEIFPGVVGLLGPNGAGKSTLFKLMIGALRPSKGQLEVFGESVRGNVALYARIGHCPDHDGIYHQLSAVEFVSLLAQLSGFSKAESLLRAHKVLDRVKLDVVARQRPMGQYSKGMRQRAKLAQAIVADPELVLLDEPLTGCDPVARADIAQLIRELGEEGKTVIVSSHILHEVEEMTEEIVLIYRGQVLAEGNIYRVRSLIDEHPHQIEIRCDAPRKLAFPQHLVTEQIESLSFLEQDGLRVETKAPDACYSAIPRIAREQQLRIESLTSPDDNLQAVFEYLTAKGRARGVGATSEAERGTGGKR